MAMPDIIGRFYKKKEPLLCVHSGRGSAEQQQIVVLNQPGLQDQSEGSRRCTEQGNLRKASNDVVIAAFGDRAVCM